MIWMGGVSRGEGKSEAGEPQNIIFHSSLIPFFAAAAFSSKICGNRFWLCCVAPMLNEQNNFPRKSQKLPVYRTNFTIYCSFVMPFSPSCFSFLWRIHFNMWFISDGEALSRQKRKVLKWFKAKVGWVSGVRECSMTWWMRIKGEREESGPRSWNEIYFLTSNSKVIWKLALKYPRELADGISTLRVILCFASDIRAFAYEEEKCLKAAFLSTNDLAASHRWRIAHIYSPLEALRWLWSSGRRNTFIRVLFALICSLRDRAAKKKESGK